MKISPKGLRLIMKWEGCELDAYKCPSDFWTIGYGHTKTARPGMSITADKAQELLREDVKYFEEQVNKLVKVPMTQGIFDALVSFTYNVGENALAQSTLLKLLNERKYAEAGDQLLRWDKSGEVRLMGLRMRREDERRMFYSQSFPKRGL